MEYFDMEYGGYTGHSAYLINIMGFLVVINSQCWNQLMNPSQIDGWMDTDA